MYPIYSRLYGRTYGGKGKNKLSNYHPRENIEYGDGDIHKYKLSHKLTPDEVRMIIINSGLWDHYDNDDNLVEIGVVPNVFFKDTSKSYGISGFPSLEKSRGGWYISYVNNMSDINISDFSKKKCGVMYFIH